ncbi:FecR domain-containing protein [Desulfovibrio desulfuricans]|uniref:FecR family protein n=1 Tax=Desulfovibrio desulfuricans TaxID=876 RepID=UPI0035B3A306
MIRYTLGHGALALCLILLAGTMCAAKDVGQVISYKAGVTAQRAGQPVALGMKSPVGDRDVLSTDATGRAQILFDDDTTVALGSNTSLSLETVVAEGPNPAFKARLGEGVARFITGKIVEKNPDGFSVVTPDATVGIRGTIFSLKVSDGTTVVFVSNTTKQVFVNGILVPSGFKITLPQGTVSPMTSSDFNYVSVSVTARNDASGAPVALAPPSTTSGAVIAPTSLAQAQTNQQGFGIDTFRHLNNAVVSGTLRNNDYQDAGTFNFHVNLANGAVSNGMMKPDGLGTLTGGSGSISGASLNVSNFTNPSYSGSMTGTAASSSGIISVDGNYTILNRSNLSEVVRAGQFYGGQHN